MSLKSLLQSSTAFGFLCGIGVVIVLLFVFHLGMTFGYGRAEGRYGLDPRRGFMGMMDPHRAFHAHGVMGQVQSATTNQFVVKTIDGLVQTVNYTNDTRIEKDFSPATASDIVADARVMIFGDTQSDGTISATIIHLFGSNLPPLPPPPMPSNSSSL